MKRSVLGGLSRAAGESAKRLQEAAEKTVEGLLQTTYVGTAEQTLRGAETVTKILHEEDRGIAEAKRSIAQEQAAKPARRKTKKRKPARRAATRSKRVPARSGSKKIKNKSVRKNKKSAKRKSATR